jgi:hypothetical protein
VEQRIPLAFFPGANNLSIDKYFGGAHAMKVTGFNHPSIGRKNFQESVTFYETVLGMEAIPSYSLGFKTSLGASLYLDRPHLKPVRRAS